MFMANIKEFRDKQKRLILFRQYRENLLAKLYQFKNAHEELVEFFEDNENFECNDFICNDYPFDKSFNELAIANWVNTIEEKLDKELERQIKDLEGK